MQAEPDPARPPKSTTTRVALAIGLALCVAALAGIAVLGVDFATSDDDTTTTSDDSGGTPVTAADVAGRTGGTHTMIDDVCGPLKSVETSPAVGEYEPETPRDYTYFVTAGCTANSADDGGGSRVDLEVKFEVSYDTEHLKGVDEARRAYESGEKVYREKDEGIEELSGLGDEAFAAPFSAGDTYWHLEVLSSNLRLRVTVFTGQGKEADVELGRQIAQTYLDATNRPGASPSP